MLPNGPMIVHGQTNNFFLIFETLNLLGKVWISKISFRSWKVKSWKKVWTKSRDDSRRAEFKASI